MNLKNYKFKLEKVKTNNKEKIISRILYVARIKQNDNINILNKSLKVLIFQTFVFFIYN